MHGLKGEDNLTKIYDAANWSKPEDDFTQLFYSQNVKQFWLPEEIALSGDLLSWKKLSPEEQLAYMKVLGGLTLLDTEQGVGVPKIAEHVKGHQRKAVLNFMAMMENAVHAKSYSNIFITLATLEEINDVFEWVKENKNLQKKQHIIATLYNSIQEDDDISLYKAMVASVLLESFLFYSGFYYPLYFYGQGKLMQAGEIINLILRDEAIHGVYIGLLAQEIFNKQSPKTQEELTIFTNDLLMVLYENEAEYTSHVYDSVGLSQDVKKFVRYNANKAMQNLALTPLFPDEEVNPIVMNGLNTKTKSHDFFSMKGTGYKMATVEAVRDEDFYFKEEVN